jgi:hypothetical protein
MSNHNFSRADIDDFCRLMCANPDVPYICINDVRNAVQRFKEQSRPAQGRVFEVWSIEEFKIALKDTYGFQVFDDTTTIALIGIPIRENPDFTYGSIRIVSESMSDPAGEKK